MKHNYQFCAVPYEAVEALSNSKNQSALVVYMQLFLNSVDNKVMISRKTLSDLTGYNPNYITEITKKLESLGLIKKEKHFNMVSTYRIVVKELEKKQETDVADSCDTVQETDVADSCDTLGAETASTANMNKSQETDEPDSCDTVQETDETSNEQITRDRLQESDEPDSNIRNLESRNTILKNTSIQNEYSTREDDCSSKDECSAMLTERIATLKRKVAKYCNEGCTWGEIKKLCSEVKNKTFADCLLGGYFQTVENFTEESYEEWFNKIIAGFKTVWDNNNTALPA